MDDALQGIVSLDLTRTIQSCVDMGARVVAPLDQPVPIRTVAVQTE